jgi:hypothetical protein
MPATRIDTVSVRLLPELMLNKLFNHELLVHCTIKDNKMSLLSVMVYVR